MTVMFSVFCRIIAFENVYLRKKNESLLEADIYSQSFYKIATIDVSKMLLLD